MSRSGTRRSDLDVRDHPLEVPSDQIPRCLIEERVVARLPWRAFTCGRRIDLDLDPIEGRAWASAIGRPDDERVVPLAVDLQATAHLGRARPVVAGDALGDF